MIFAKWILLLLIGKVIIHIAQKFELPKFIKKIDWFVKLHSCDLCLGVYCYAFLSLFFEMDLLSVLGFGYIPFVSQAITGILVSWLVHIFTLGWKAKYEIVVI